MDFTQRISQFLLFLWFILGPISAVFAESNYSDYEDYVVEIEAEFAKQMEEWNLFCKGTGGSMSNKIKIISLDLVAHHPSTIEEARALIVLATEKLRQCINAHNKIRPYLREYPFPHGRIELSIGFHYPLNYPRAEGSVSRVFHVGSLATTSSRNHLIYRAYDPFQERFVDLYEEPYQEALKIVMASGLKEPPVHQMTELEVASDELLVAYAGKMAENGLRVVSMGGKMQNGLEEMGLTLIVYYPATQEIARELIVFATESLLKMMNESEKLRPHLKEYPFPSSLVKMCIDFRDKRHINYFDGIAMKNVILNKNEVSYIQELTVIDEETNKLSSMDIVLFGKEPYEEALKKIGNPASEPKLSKIYSIIAKKPTLWEKFCCFLKKNYHSLKLSYKSSPSFFNGKFNFAPLPIQILIAVIPRVVV